MKSYGKHNATVLMRVERHSESVDGKVRVGLTTAPRPGEKEKKKDRDSCGCCPQPVGGLDSWLKISSAELAIPADEADHYPVGSMVAIHCVPHKGKSKDDDGYRPGEDKGARSERMAESLEHMSEKKEY